MNFKNFLAVSVVSLAAVASAVAAEVFPDVSTLDKNWDKDAVAIKNFAWQNVDPAADLTVLPAAGNKGSGATMAWPYPKQVSEFMLDKPMNIKRITVVVEAMKNSYRGTAKDFVTGVFYVSNDGKTYRKVVPVTEPLFYLDNGKCFDRVTFKGDFAGQYFRLHAPWKNLKYIYKFRLLPGCVKFFAK